MKWSRAAAVTDIIMKVRQHRIFDATKISDEHYYMKAST